MKLLQALFRWVRESSQRKDRTFYERLSLSFLSQVNRFLQIEGKTGLRLSACDADFLMELRSFLVNECQFVHHYTRLELDDRYRLMCAAFGA